MELEGCQTKLETSGSYFSTRFNCVCQRLQERPQPLERKDHQTTGRSCVARSGKRKLDRTKNQLPLRLTLKQPLFNTDQLPVDLILDTFNIPVELSTYLYGHRPLDRPRQTPKRLQLDPRFRRYNYSNKREMWKR